MSFAARGREFAALLREVDEEPYSTLLTRVAPGPAEALNGRTWSDVIDRAHTLGIQDPTVNDLAGRLLAAYATDRTVRWTNLLLLLAWRELESLHSQRRRYDPCPEERWSSIQWAFMRAVDRLAGTPLPGAALQHLRNLTRDGLRTDYRREWNRREDELTLAGYDDDPDDGDDPGERDVPSLDHGFRAFEDREEREALLAELARLHHEGLLNRRDLALLVETEVYGKSLTEAGRSLGLMKDAAKQRRRRALAAIERNRKQSSLFLSPPREFDALS